MQSPASAAIRSVIILRGREELVAQREAREAGFADVPLLKMKVVVQVTGVLSEFWNLVLLVLLYGMQGVPLGLCLGSMCASLAVCHRVQCHP